MTNKIDQLLSEKNKHPFDKYIKFRAEDHKYWINDDDTDLISSTTFIHKFFEDFETDKIIKNILKSKNYKDPKYKYYKMSYDAIKEQWSENARIASEAGTKMHEKIENFYNDLEVEYDEEKEPEFGQFLEFYEDHKHLEIYRTEWMIYSEMLKITGSIDAVFKNKDGTISLGDWKRSKEIHYKSFNNKCGNYPFENMNDCNFVHYSLQLNLYRIILEKFYNQKIKDMFLVICHPDNKDNKYIKVPIKIMEKEAEYLLDYRKKQLIELKYSEEKFKDFKLTNTLSEKKKLTNLDDENETKYKRLLK